MLCWVCIVYGGFKAIEFLRRSCARMLAGLKPRNMLEEYGHNSWAIITGSSDGIGEEFAKQLARIGFNICLVSRTKSKLERVQSDIQQLNPSCKTKIVVADFSHAASEPSIFDRVYDSVKDLDVSLLINSAGLYDVGLF